MRLGPIAEALSSVSSRPLVVEEVSPDQVALLEAMGCRVVVAVVAGVSSEKDLLRALGEALDFPAYFGANWDAFDDCMNDSAGSDVVVVVTGWRELVDRSPAVVLRASHMLAQVSGVFAQADQTAEFVWVAEWTNSEGAE